MDRLSGCCPWLFCFMQAVAARKLTTAFYFSRCSVIIVMKKNATQDQIHHVTEWIKSVGYPPHPSQGVERTLIGAIGDDRGKAQLKSASFLPGVEKIMPILKPYKLASREFQETDTIVRVGEVRIGGGEFTVIAGPCSIESEEQMMECGYVAKKAGAKIIRGGAFKPRTSPYSFQGMEEEGLKLLKKAEYILSEGNDQIILCERGIRTFETTTRNTLDISAVPVLKELTHLPVIIDPSHAAGHAKYVLALPRAAVAVGADGVIVEVHPEPEKAFSDGAQSLRPEQFYRLLAEGGGLEDAMRNGIGRLQ